MEYSVEVDHLSKYYSKVKVLNEISFQIRSGEVFGLLGPSGAGKTTILKILTGQISYEGVGKVLDTHCCEYSSAIYKKMGVVLDNTGLFERLSCYENLKIFALLNSVMVKEIDSALERVNLLEERNKKVSQLSKGMQQRLCLARAIMHRPKVLFLDEPTSGLDPVTTRYIHQIIEELTEQETTIMLTTHNMEEAYKACNYVGLLSKGELIEYGSPSQVCQKHHEDQGYAAVLKNGKKIKLSNTPAELLELTELIKRGDIQSLKTIETDLEQVFIKLTGERLL